MGNRNSLPCTLKLFCHLFRFRTLLFSSLSISVYLILSSLFFCIFSDVFLPLVLKFFYLFIFFNIYLSFVFIGPFCSITICGPHVTLSQPQFHFSTVFNSKQVLIAIGKIYWHKDFQQKKLLLCFSRCIRNSIRIFFSSRNWIEKFMMTCDVVNCHVSLSN